MAITLAFLQIFGMECLAMTASMTCTIKKLHKCHGTVSFGYVILFQQCTDYYNKT